MPKELGAEYSNTFDPQQGYAKLRLLDDASHDDPLLKYFPPSMSLLQPGNIMTFRRDGESISMMYLGRTERQLQFLRPAGDDFRIEELPVEEFIQLYQDGMLDVTAKAKPKLIGDYHDLEELKREIQLTRHVHWDQLKPGNLMVHMVSESDFEQEEILRIEPCRERVGYSLVTSLRQRVNEDGMVDHIELLIDQERGDHELMGEPAPVLRLSHEQAGLLTNGRHLEPDEVTLSDKERHELRRHLLAVPADANSCIRITGSSANAAPEDVGASIVADALGGADESEACSGLILAGGFTEMLVRRDGAITGERRASVQDLIEDLEKRCPRAYVAGVSIKGSHMKDVEVEGETLTMLCPETIVSTPDEKKDLDYVTVLRRGQHNVITYDCNPVDANQLEPNWLWRAEYIAGRHIAAFAEERFLVEQPILIVLGGGRTVTQEVEEYRRNGNPVIFIEPLVEGDTTSAQYIRQFKTDPSSQRINDYVVETDSGHAQSVEQLRFILKTLGALPGGSEPWKTPIRPDMLVSSTQSAGEQAVEMARAICTEIEQALAPPVAMLLAGLSSQEPVDLGQGRTLDREGVLRRFESFHRNLVEIPTKLSIMAPYRAFGDLDKLKEVLNRETDWHDRIGRAFMLLKLLFTTHEATMPRSDGEMIEDYRTAVDFDSVLKVLEPLKHDLQGGVQAAGEEVPAPAMLEREPTVELCRELAAVTEPHQKAPDNPGAAFYGYVNRHHEPAKFRGLILQGADDLTIRDKDGRLQAFHQSFPPDRAEQVEPGLARAFPGYRVRIDDFIVISAEATEPALYSRLVDAALVQGIISDADLAIGYVHRLNARSVITYAARGGAVPVAHPVLFVPSDYDGEGQYPSKVDEAEFVPFVVAISERGRELLRPFRLNSGDAVELSKLIEARSLPGMYADLPGVEERLSQESRNRILFCNDVLLLRGLTEGTGDFVLTERQRKALRRILPTDDARDEIEGLVSDLGDASDSDARGLVKEFLDRHHVPSTESMRRRLEDEIGSMSAVYSSGRKQA